MDGHASNDSTWPPPTVQHDPVLQAVWSYWAARRGSRRCPARADIDPLDIPRLLPHIGLIDVEDAGTRFRYRLIGTDMNRTFGYDFTGEYLDDTKKGAYADFLRGLYAEAATGRCPLFSESVFGYRDRRHLTIRRLILPLATSDADPVGMLLFSNTFRRREPGDPEIDAPLSTPHDLPYRSEDIVQIRAMARRQLRT